MNNERDIHAALCACPACAGAVNDDGISYEASVDGQAGSLRDKPIFTIEEAAYYLNRGDGLITSGGVTYESGAFWDGAANAGNRWYGGAQSKTKAAGDPLQTLTFGFYETTADILPVYNVFAGNAPGLKRLSGFSAFDEAQRDAARQAIDTWNELIAIDFVETSAANADINFMNTTTGPAQASAFLPYNYGAFYEGIQGDVAVNPNQASNHQFDEGEYGLTTLIHELGHSLGLEHPGSYNFGPNFSATYVNGAEYYQDSNQYSIMSYWRAQETGANHVDWTTTTLKYASTPSVHDVAAIQRIYGADMTTRTGDTVYGFNTNTGLDTFDFAKTPHPVITIWDAGGNDTLDLSGFNTPSVINLNPGQFSSAGGSYLDAIPSLAESNAARVAAGLAPRSEASYNNFVNAFKIAFNNNLMSDNIAIAYGADIENAIGGGGNDLIIANALANVIDGRGGVDTVSYRVSDAGVNVKLGTSAAQSGGYAQGDVLKGIENVDGSDFADTITGDNGANVLNGFGGDDHLIGGAGDDVLDGGAGNDVLVGGGGTDLYLFGHTGRDVINGFQKGEKIDFSDFGGLARISKNTVFIDVDDNGTADLTIVVNGGSVTHSDLIIA